MQSILFQGINSLLSLRKMRDSNPRYPKKGIPDFESGAFVHSANLPHRSVFCFLMLQESLKDTPKLQKNI